MDVAGADAGAEADAGDVQAQALGGFQVAAFETGEEESSGGALLSQRDGSRSAASWRGAGAADNDAGVAHIARGDEAVHEAAEDDDVEGAAEEVFGGGDGDGRCGRLRSRCFVVFARFVRAGRREGRTGLGRGRAL